VAAAEELGWVAGVYEPDEDLAAEVLAAVRPGRSDDTPGEIEALLLQHKEKIRSWVKPEPPHRRGLKLTKVHELLERRGVKVSYSGLHRYAVKHLEFGQNRMTVRVADVDPGELAEVDFGKLGMIPDPETGKKRVLHALIVTLVHSRHQYVHLTHSQKLQDLLEGLEDAFEFFGGVPRRVVIDNLKAAVTKADRYDPAFHRSFAAYADHRGFVIDAANVRHPTGKPHVERQVQYVRESFFKGETFLSLSHARREAVRWCLGKAGLRIHGTTRKMPLREFEAHEKPALLPLTKERFDPPMWAEPKVHPDFHIQFNYALYSVPYQYRGKQVTVCADSKMVRIYCCGKQIKIHPLQPPGGRSTDPNDYPPEKTEYAMRDTDRMIKLAAEHGEAIGLFTAKLLSGTYPWSRLRQAQALMRLVQKYGASRVNPACERALRFDLIKTKKVQSIIEDGLDREKLAALRPGTRGQIVQLNLRFMRDAESFNHHQKTSKEDK
jgi:hypothetical protein